MVPFAGYLMPVQYEGIIAEHLWTRSSAGLFDVSHMGQLGVSGGDVEDGGGEEGGGGVDAAAALEALLPGDIRSLKPGRMRYSLLLAASGGILDDLIVTYTGRDYAVVVNGATKWDDIAHLREHLPDEITLTHFDEQALLALQGPKAVMALTRLGLAPLHDDVAPVAALRFMQAGIYDWGGRRIAVSRSGYTGEDGFELSVSAEHVTALADVLCEQPEVRPIGLGARDSLRLEAGLPLYGHDLDETIDPVTAGLEFAISRRRRVDGGFAGAALILGRLRDGAASRRVGLILEGRLAAREGTHVFHGDQDVGAVTSGGFSPSLGRPIAMAYVAAAAAADGTALDIEVRGKRLAATVAPLPFVPHQYVR